MKLQSREVTWNNLELTGLLEDEESRVHFTRTIKHLALHPYHLNNVQKGLNQILKSSLNSYDREYVIFFTHNIKIFVSQLCVYFIVGILFILLLLSLLFYYDLLPAFK